VGVFQTVEYGQNEIQSYPQADKTPGRNDMPLGQLYKIGQGPALDQLHGKIDKFLRTAHFINLNNIGV